MLMAIFVSSGESIFQISIFNCNIKKLNAKLFESLADIRYPCISNRTEYNEVKVYSGPLGSLRFLYGDRSLITVGGTDASLMIWELIEE